MEVVIFADAPAALTKLCGVSLLERQLRILQRLGVKNATIISATPEKIRAAIEPPSWARSELATRIISDSQLEVRERALFLRADIYCDARLIAALAQHGADCELVDSHPPAQVLALMRRLKRTSRGYRSGAGLAKSYDSLGDGAAIDAATVPAYIMSMRRTLRPIFFAAPPPELRKLAESLILNTGQNGTLDIPGRLQSPVEDWVMRWLWRTSITPNQITGFTFLVALIAAGFFATGHLWLGMILALSIGVLDGLDGKQARVKIETTAGGKWEHYLDFAYETAWWAALAFWFQSSGQLRQAWIYFLIIMAAEGLDKIGKHIARVRINRLLDDYTPFDRFVRLIAARRDVYLWAIAIGLAFGAAASTYRLCAVWGMVTAGVHLLRGGMITLRSSKIAKAPRQIAPEPRQPAA